MEIINVNEMTLKATRPNNLAASIHKGCTIKEIAEMLASRVVLATDFKHKNNFPLAVLSVKVRKTIINKLSVYHNSFVNSDGWQKCGSE